MNLSEFTQQPRGGRRFEIWIWGAVVRSAIGELPVELHTSLDSHPSEEMVTFAAQLATYAETHGDFLLDLIYGHYRHAEEKGWLSFWNVPGSLGRDQVLGQVESITLVVDEDFAATVFVNPRWDEEHKLDLLFEGKITRVNDSPFELVGEILAFT